MKYIASIFLMAVVSSYATLLSAQEVPDYLRQYQTNGFPKNDRSVRFEDHSRSFPPKPLGMVETTHPIEFRALTSSLITPERSRDTVQRLVAMPEVKRAIGNRYIAISVGLAEPKSKVDPIDASRLRITFFNYGANRAVEVIAAEGERPLVTPLAVGYQPPETREEVEAAAKIARAVPRIRSQVSDWEVRGIMTPAPKGHRYIYLIFRDSQNQKAPYVATVDMTGQTVVSSGTMPTLGGP